MNADQNQFDKLTIHHRFLQSKFDVLYRMAYTLWVTSILLTGIVMGFTFNMIINDGVIVGGILLLLAIFLPHSVFWVMLYHYTQIKPE